MRRCERVGRAVLAALVLVGGVPAVASAQFTGWAQVSFGKTSGGDTTDDGNAFAGAVTAFEGRGWFGAEAEIAHSTRFNDERFADSGLSTLMVNLVVSPHTRTIQPNAIGGVGLIRARGCGIACERTLSRTDFGIDAGGGLRVPVTELLAVQADVRYFRVLKQGDDFPRTASGSFNFFRVAVGIGLTWHSS